MVATGRTMDWKTDMHSNLWVFPRGMERNGETGKDSLAGLETKFSGREISGVALKNSLMVLILMTKRVIANL